MSAQYMLYVAADPQQPGAAWAACVDDPKYAKDTADTIADWIRRGGIVQRVDRDTASDMLSKWVRAEKKAQDNQGSLL